MEYLEQNPCTTLNSYVHKYWFFKNNTDELKTTILPDGCFDLIISISNNKITQILLTGIWTKQKHVSVEPNIIQLSIRFRIIAAELFFNKELKSLLETSTLLPLDFWGISAIKDYKFDFFINYVEEILLNILTNNQLNEQKIKLFEILYSSKGDIEVSEIAKTLNWSTRSINRYFNKQFGFPLKTFISILRCNAAYKQISNGDLFPSNNYYDQSHFIKEIKNYTGFTPKELYLGKDDRFLQLNTIKKN